MKLTDLRKRFQSRPRAKVKIGPFEAEADDVDFQPLSQAEVDALEDVPEVPARRGFPGARRCVRCRTTKHVERRSVMMDDARSVGVYICRECEAESAPDQDDVFLTHPEAPKRRFAPNEASKRSRKTSPPMRTVPKCDFPDCDRFAAHAYSDGSHRCTKHEK